MLSNFKIDPKTLHDIISRQFVLYFTQKKTVSKKKGHITLILFLVATARQAVRKRLYRCKLHRFYRYCHSFSDAEIDHLAASVAPEATVLSRFTSDGRTNALNTYLVPRKREEVEGS
jgi:hypothetical protein